MVTADVMHIYLWLTDGPLRESGNPERGASLGKEVSILTVSQAIVYRRVSSWEVLRQLACLAWSLGLGIGD
jgi:hypothetical protein